MIDALALAIGFVIVAVTLFAVAVRLGMLVGRRLDRVVEALTVPAVDDAIGARPADSWGTTDNAGEHAVRQGGDRVE
jgi:hypothetical protein